jgi:hypothetical protein
MNEPRLESRISFLEKQFIALGGYVEELSSDTAENFRDLKQDMKRVEDGMMSSFKKIGDTIIDTLATKDDLKPLATKDDLVALEGRIKGDITEIKEDIAEMKSLMQQLLQQKSGE